jgi:hypothetical protein
VLYVKNLFGHQVEHPDKLAEIRTALEAVLAKGNRPPTAAAPARGMKGVYQHCGEKHLHRYLAEFDFRYSNRIALGIDDGERAERALRSIVGKRLTYRGRVDSTA